MRIPRQAMDAVASNTVLGLSSTAPAIGIQTGLPLASAAATNSAIVANNFLNLNQVRTNNMDLGYDISII